MEHVVNWRLDLMLSHPRLFEVMSERAPPLAEVSPPARCDTGDR
jgi:hypothetical protein